MIQDLLFFYGNGEARFGAIIEQFKVAAQEGSTSAHGLTELMRQSGSDKADHHNYPLMYDFLIKSLDRVPKTLLEVGMGTNNTDIVGNMGAEGVPGASLRAWRSYLPGAMIYGADYDVGILKDEENIRTFYIDQYMPETIVTAWSLLPHLFFDIIIDDGAHTFEANRNLLDASMSRLNQRGLYIVEDVVMDHRNVAAFDEYLQARGWSGFFYKLPHISNAYDNAIIVLEAPGKSGAETSNVPITDRS